jgi:MFS transporter, DHA3 family, macrolide efflux protein
MSGFLLIWSGQMLSAIASSTTTFALYIWIIKQTAGGSSVGMMEFFFFSATLLMAPVAGIMVDRYSRKVTMLVYDIASLAITVLILFLYFFNALQVWHLYVATIVQGVGYAFQWPAYRAAISTMLPKERYARANGMLYLLDDVPDVFSPILAGVILGPLLGLTGILAINIAAFVFSIAALSITDIPQTPQTLEGEKSHGVLWKELTFGFLYIVKRPGLLGLQLIFLTGNLFFGIALSAAVFYPMILLRTGNNTEVLGFISTVGSLAAVIAGIVITTWGGIKRPLHGILMGWIVSSVLGLVLLGLGQGLLIWVVAMAIEAMCDPLTKVSDDTLLQRKVPPEFQGRVFGAQSVITQVMIPFAPLIGGYLGDRVFEPVMRTHGSLAAFFGPLVGTGPGSGMSLLIFLCGIGATLVGVCGYLLRSVRNLDVLLPDHDVATVPGILTFEAQPVPTHKLKTLRKRDSINQEQDLNV